MPPVANAHGSTQLKPKHVKGIYLSLHTLSSDRLDKLITLADQTEINSFVIDIKNDAGQTYKDIAPQLPKILKKLKKHNIYPIARIVVFKDSRLIRQKSHLSARHKNGNLWADRRGRKEWLDPYSKEVWDYSINLAKEVVDLGITEIQWDYVRFPAIKKSKFNLIRYPQYDGRTRREVISGFLKYSKEQLPGVIITADVFGATTRNKGDLGIGQHWESMLKYADVLLPMVYPSHYWKDAYGYKHPNSNPYGIVYAALKDAVKRSPSPASIRPWLQAFTLGKPKYTRKHIRAQIKAAKDNNIHEWVLWNARNVYPRSFFN